MSSFADFSSNFFPGYDSSNVARLTPVSVYTSAGVNEDRTPRQGTYQDWNHRSPSHQALAKHLLDIADVRCSVEYVCKMSLPQDSIANMPSGTNFSAKARAAELNAARARRALQRLEMEEAEAEAASLSLAMSTSVNDAKGGADQDALATRNSHHQHSKGTMDDRSYTSLQSHLSHPTDALSSSTYSSTLVSKSPDDQTHALNSRSREYSTEEMPKRRGKRVDLTSQEDEGHPPKSNPLPLASIPPSPGANLTARPNVQQHHHQDSRARSRGTSVMPLGASQLATSRAGHPPVPQVQPYHPGKREPSSQHSSHSRGKSVTPLWASEAATSRAGHPPIPQMQPYHPGKHEPSSQHSSHSRGKSVMPHESGSSTFGGNYQPQYPTSPAHTMTPSRGNPHHMPASPYHSQYMQGSPYGQFSAQQSVQHPSQYPVHQFPSQPLPSMQYSGPNQQSAVYSSSMVPPTPRQVDRYVAHSPAFHPSERRNSSRYHTSVADSLRLPDFNPEIGFVGTDMGEDPFKDPLPEMTSVSSRFQDPPQYPVQHPPPNYSQVRLPPSAVKGTNASTPRRGGYNTGRRGVEVNSAFDATHYDDFGPSATQVVDNRVPYPQDIRMYEPGFLRRDDSQDQMSSSHNLEVSAKSSVIHPDDSVSNYQSDAFTSSGISKSRLRPSAKAFTSANTPGLVTMSSPIRQNVNQGGIPLERPTQQGASRPSASAMTKEAHRGHKSKPDRNPQEEIDDETNRLLANMTTKEFVDKLEQDAKGPKLSAVNVFDPETPAHIQKMHDTLLRQSGYVPLPSGGNNIRELLSKDSEPDKTPTRGSNIAPIGHERRTSSTPDGPLHSSITSRQEATQRATISLVAPVLANLGAYRGGTDRGPYANFSQPPAWCIDHSPEGNKSLFSNGDWGNRPDRVARNILRQPLGITRDGRPTYYENLEKSGSGSGSTTSSHGAVTIIQHSGSNVSGRPGSHSGSRGGGSDVSHAGSKTGRARK